MLAIGIWMRRAETVPWSATTRLERLQLLAMGVFVTGTTLSLFSAFERSTIALSLIVFYTYPTMVAVAAVRLYGESLGLLRSAAILIASSGMVLVVMAPTLDGDALQLDSLAILFALMAAVFQTGYALTASRGFASVPAIQAATIVRGFAMVFCGVIVIPLVVLVGDGASLVEPLFSVEAWVLIIIAGTLGAALPTAGLLAGYRRVGPTRGAVLMLFEPVVGVFLAALWLAERPGPLQLVGGFLVLTGAALVQLEPSARSNAAKTSPTGDTRA
jgi:drug/metabolite transporter (DMT)-like permease